MSYTVLARKWRPKRFEDLVGQEHILKILSNSLALKRLHHAYLFCGTRGVGKTTLARIFAKCLNCQEGVTATPCNQCNHCEQINQGQFVDLIEIDAASRTKVEDTRELLENVQYAPTAGRYKVYLIDEVHMLSTHSFNALLKTLEEPPPHVIFALATTDPQKLPITILSRCLKLQLQMISEEQLAHHLTAILKQETIDAEPQAIAQLASAAKGSARDALSLTDQAIVYCNGNINTDAVSQMLGLVNQDHLWTLLTAIHQQNSTNIMDTIHTMGLNADNFVAATEALQTLLYQMTLHQMSPDSLAKRTPDYEKIATHSACFSAQTLQLYYQILTVGKKDITLAPTPQIGFEMLLMRLVAFSPASSSQAPTMAAPTATVTPPTATQPTTTAAQSPAETGAMTTITQDNWHAIIPQLNISGMTKILAGHCSVGNIQDDRLELCISDKQGALSSEKQAALLGSAISAFLEKPTQVVITVTTEENQETPMKRQQEERRHQHNQAQHSIDNDDNIKKLMGMFDASVDNSSIETNN